MALQWRSWRWTGIPRYVKTPLLLSLLVSSTTSLVVLVEVFRLQPVVPVWYTLAQPNQQLTTKEWLFIFPALCFTMTILHFGLLASLRHYGQLMTKLMVWTTLVFQLLLTGALLRIVWIVS